MHPPNQGDGASQDLPAPVPAAEDAPREPVPGNAWAPGTVAPDDTSIPAPPAHDSGALVFWLVAVCIALPLSWFFGQVELGLLTAVGAMFAVAHAAERDRRWNGLHAFLGGIPPGGAAAMFIAMAVWFTNARLFLDVPLPRADRLAGAVLSALAAVGSLALLIRPVATWAARRAFGVAEPGSVDRLGARLVVICFLVAAPGWFFVQALMATSQLDQIAIGPGSFAGSLVGFTMLTLGAVGFPVRRGWHATAERLGLRRIAWREIALIAGGLLALVVLNAAMEWATRTWQPVMYRRDQSMNELIAGRLTGLGTLMLGISAGVGEELAMRGALLPRLGLVATSLLFAALHVQYSPFGMLTIGMIGLLLGVIRRRGGTTSAIAVHVLYDIMAAFGAQH